MKHIFRFLFLSLLTSTLAHALPIWYSPDGNFVPLSQMSTTYSKMLDLDRNSELRELQTQRDELGYTHYRYQQYNLGIPIWGALLSVHITQGGNVFLLNGNIAKPFRVAADVPVWSEAEALQQVLLYSGAKQFAWDDKHLTACLREVRQDANATFFPKGELWWLEINTDNSAEYTHRLCYRFDIYASKPLKREYIFVDALNGTILNTQNRLCETDAAAAGHAGHACEETVDITASVEDGIYSLKESTRGNGIHTYTAQQSWEFVPNFVTDTDAYFDNDPTALDVHWGTEKTYDFFNVNFSRNSLDNNGHPLNSWVHYGNNLVNAFWDGNALIYGDGNGTTFESLTSLDIVAHEFTHGITEFEAGLVYANEPGALSESFSDIFGTVVEFFANGECADWIIASEVVILSGKNGLRNMSNPNDPSMLTRCPDTYKGQFWQHGANDHGGVHSNSGVQNFWFYLLANGGTGTNDNEDTYTVNGIGMEAAAQIAYRNLTTYLSPLSQYSDARMGAIQAAKDLFGQNSNEVQQVIAAWCAVGVGNCDASNDQINLMAPNGGETWYFGETKQIEWSTNGNVQTARIEYSTDGGAIWKFIAITNADEGYYNWQIPQITTNTALVRVVDAATISVQDVSNNYFELVGCALSASFELPSIICLNAPIQFQADLNNPSNSNVSYLWQIDEDSVGMDAQLNYLFETSGNYTVQLTVSNDWCNYSCFKNIYVIKNADANFQANAMDTRTIVVATTSTSEGEYTWNFGDGTSATGQTATHQYETSGEYLVCHTHNNACGSDTQCQTVQTQLNLPCNNSNNAPQALFVASQTQTCSGTSVSFDNQSSGANTYQWFVDGQMVATGNDFTHAFQLSGTHWVMLAAINEYCYHTYSQVIAVSAGANMLNLPDIAACGTTVLSSNLNPEYVYEWYFNANLIGTEATTEVAQSGVYMLKVTDNCANTKTVIAEIWIDNDCVTPGDINKDGIVNNIDLLYWGWAAGFQGEARQNAQLDFEPQMAPSWSDFFPNGVNFKHADTNGNGIVDTNDVKVITDNYGLTYQTNAPPTQLLNPIEGSISTGLTSASLIGNKVIINWDISLDADDIASSLSYGIAFRINFEVANALKINSVFIDFKPIENEYNIKAIQKTVWTSPNKGYIEVGLSNHDHQNHDYEDLRASAIAEVEVIEAINSVDFALNSTNIRQSLTNKTLQELNDNDTIFYINTNSLMATNPNEDLNENGAAILPQTINEIGNDLTNKPRMFNNWEETSLIQLQTYPNPNKGNFSIILAATNTGTAELNIRHATGALMQTKQITMTQADVPQTIDITELPAGIYLIEAKMNNSRTVQKVIVL